VKAALQWRLLQEGFGRPVAEAYRDGMKRIWRLTPDERPKHNTGNTIVVKHTTILSFSGLGIEAAEDLDWVARLSAAEAERAALHACLSEQGYPNWLETLVDHHPTIVLPVLRRALREEWLGLYGGRSDFFSHLSGTHDPIQEPVQQVLFEIITGRKPKASDMLDRGLGVLHRLDLNDAQRHRVASLARRRLHSAQASDQDELVQRYLAMLFLVDPDGATREFVAWLDSAPKTSRDTRAESTFAALFGHHSPLAADALQKVSVASLEILVRHVFQRVRPQDDRRHEGAYTPGARDLAEEARRTLLNTLVGRFGADAYWTMRTLAADPTFQDREVWFRELAHGKAEHDAELPAWTPAEVLSFEQLHVAPAKTGGALLRVVMGVLSDIQSSFIHADATSRSLLERAEDEDEVQAWLVEQMNHLSRGRYHAHREVKVALGDKPDIIVSSTTAPVEVGVEVKHGGMKWTVRDLERALTKQLAEGYLKPDTRRCGVLVVSHHGRRKWRDPDTRATLDFHDVINRLQALATTVVRNKVGPVQIRAFGVDASPPSKGVA